METEVIIVWLFVGFTAWIVLGAIVLSAMDDESLSLLRWAKDCPFGGAPTVMIAWPWFVWWIHRNVENDDEQPNA